METKSDASPVTVADREAEEAVRSVLKKHCPDYGILGEESGWDWPGEAGEAEYLWVIDPIDGTKSFITGAALCYCASNACLHSPCPHICSSGL